MAVGSFFAGVVVTLLILLLLVFVKRRKKKKTQVDVLPMTAREQQVGDSHTQNRAENNTQRREKDIDNFRGDAMSLCLPFSACV